MRISPPSDYLLPNTTERDLYAIERDLLFRAAVAAKTGGCCYYCGTDRNLGIDHIRARARGGNSNIKNLVLACRRCNSRKCARTMEEFRHYSALQALGYPVMPPKLIEWARQRGADLREYDAFQFWFERQPQPEKRAA